MTKDLTKTSKFLSLILRHRPESVGLTLGPQGWASIDELIRLTAANKSPRRLTRALIETLANDPENARFELSDDGARVRAAHGHSVAVELEMAPATPPEILYHGTVPRFMAAILAEGLKPQGRRFVHLSETAAAARRVGARRGAPVILEIRAGEMHRAGQVFHRSTSGVWLTGSVPPERILRSPKDGAGRAEIGRAPR